MKLTQQSLASLSLLLVALAACGEKKTDAEVTAKAEAAANSEAKAGAEATASAEATLPEAETIVEEHDGGSVAWNVGADGQVKALVKGPDSKAIRENVSASLVWKAGGETKDVPLELDAKTGLFVAAGPKLEADLTELDYTVTVGGKPWKGALHVPVGGTASLVAGAKAAADIKVPEGKLGPNGGVIQVVGKDRLELVADEVTGEVRVYVLDADLNAVAVGEREVSLGVVADATPVTIALAPVEAGAYFVGKWALAADPLKLTIAMKNAGQTHCALVGYRPGARIVVGASAPRVKVRVKTRWEARADALADVDANARADARGAVKVAVPKPDLDAKAGARADVRVKAPSVSVKVQPPKITPPKIQVKAGVSAKAGAGAGIKFP
ncbi:hypothetical protein [Polyangium aurulentum]|uniref:hypothetical protein n=1 Tax=Polyangium aurulentum TaxID=2567896 RepID=UPI0010AEC080|nr:hypothetical protein [Polyangium aurulentum]UQA59560.1 hypothetical protein E8A73_003350 [Polyangium aurulentum]